MTNHSTILYVSCGESQTIVRFAVDTETGKLSKIGETLLPGAPEPAAENTAKITPQLRSNGAPLAVGPQGAVLYVATRTEPCCALAYRISPTDGALALIGQGSIPKGTPYVATGLRGRYLFGAAYHANNVWVSRIGDDGELCGSPIQTIENLGTAHCVLVHSNDRILYVASTGLTGIQIFGLRNCGEPLCDHRSAVAASLDATPRHLAMRPDDRFLYCMNETSSIVDVFAVSDDGGTLTLVQSVDLRPVSVRGAHGVGADIIVSHDGRSLYCTERVRGTVSVFSIDTETGKLSPVQTIVAGNIPRSVALDPTGRFLACALQGDGILQIYAVSPDDGSLTHCASYETGGTPVWASFVVLPFGAQSRVI